MTEAILILSVVNVMLGIFAAWQRHQTVKPVLEKRRKKAEKLARKRQHEVPTMKDWADAG